jgi:F0F1-type ATP synthase assembly protein I
MSEGKNKPYKKPCDKSYEKSVYRSFVMIVQFGINMLVPICAMSALGIFLDKKLGTSYIMVILFFVGAMAGAQNIYRMAKSIFESEEEDMRAQDKNFQNNESECIDNDIITDIESGEDEINR